MPGQGRVMTGYGGEGRTARGASAEQDIVDRAGQRSPAHTMVEQSKQEQHRAYITSDVTY